MAKDSPLSTSNSSKLYRQSSLTTTRNVFTYSSSPQSSPFHKLEDDIVHLEYTMPTTSSTSSTIASVSGITSACASETTRANVTTSGGELDGKEVDKTKGRRRRHSTGRRVSFTLTKPRLTPPSQGHLWMHSPQVGRPNNDSKQDNFSLFRTRSVDLNAGLSRQNSSSTSSIFTPKKEIHESSVEINPHQDDDHIQNDANVFSSSSDHHTNEDDAMQLPAGRYFAALRGPELDVLRASEEVLLPTDTKWPFLLRFPITCFGICLGLGGQTMLWKLLSISTAMKFLHTPSYINLVLWSIALLSLIVISTTYLLKCIFYIEAVKREYYHPVRMNFFFAPWIACMFLAIGIPPAISPTIHPSLFVISVTPLMILELKIYGQWISGGERRLSKVANPTSHLSVVGNFVAAILATRANIHEAGVFFWAVGLVHYMVLFVTLYQRLPTNETIPRELHPVFFLFIAAPSTASVGWMGITGEFDNIAKICYFIALFLFTTLIVRINLFRGFRFSLSWWAYSFPTASVAIATIRYSNMVTNRFTQYLAVILTLISSVAMSALFITTLLHAFVWGTLFPNDLAVAITTKRYTSKHKFKRPTLKSIRRVVPSIASSTSSMFLPDHKSIKLSTMNPQSFSCNTYNQENHQGVDIVVVPQSK